MDTLSVIAAVVSVGAGSITADIAVIVTVTGAIADVAPVCHGVAPCHVATLAANVELPVLLATVPVTTTDAATIVASVLGEPASVAFAAAAAVGPVSAPQQMVQ